MRRSPLLALTLLASIGVTAQEIPPEASQAAFASQSCGESVSRQSSPLPLPAGVTGRVAFYAAEYDPSSLQIRNSIRVGEVNEVQPIASAFKPLVVELTLRDVDAGRLTLETLLETTEATRSIEDYPPGKNSVLHLARRAIQQSDNTASDLLLLNLGPERFTRSVLQRSPCTQVFLTSKAAWAAQGGLLSAVLGLDLPVGASSYASLNTENKLRVAAQLIAAAQEFTGPQVEEAIDVYFRGPQQSPQIDLDLQHSSTARACTNLVARVYTGRNLQPNTRKVFREILTTGCCRPKQPKMQFTYWGAKAGSGWRTLSLSGLVELAGGRMLAYTYLNDQSDTAEAEDMEKQIRPVVTWIEQNLLALLAE